MINDKWTGYNAQVAEFEYMKVVVKKIELLETKIILLKVFIGL